MKETEHPSLAEESDALLRAAGPAFAALRDCRGDGTAEIEFMRTTAGRWWRRVFHELERQGRLDLLGVVRYADVTIRIETREGRRVQVAQVVRVHGLMVCMRIGDGSGVVGADEALARAAETEPAIRRLVAVVGDAPGDVTILVNPPATPPTRNADGSYRMLERCPVTVPPHAVARMHRFATKKTSTVGDHAKARRVLNGGELADEANEIERLYRRRESGELTQSDAAELGETLWDFGVANAPSRRRAGRQWAEVAASRARREPQAMDPATLPAEVDARSVETTAENDAERERVRNRLAADPRSAAALDYAEGRLGRRPKASRSDVAGRHGVTVDALRAAETRHAAEIARVLGA